jgi:cerevisin
MKFELVLQLAALTLSYLGAESAENRYLIRFNRKARSTFESLVGTVREQFVTRGGLNQINHEYDAVYYGVAATLDTVTKSRIQSLPHVLSIVPDYTIKAEAVQNKTTWGLGRISSKGALSGFYGTYYYNPTAGEGVNVYVLDSGIRTTHIEFGGRAEIGITFAQNVTDTDKFGHGTHCAGTVAGTKYGVAKQAKVISVKILNDQGSGYGSDRIAGLNWVVKNANGVKGNVVSLSVGSVFDEGTNQVVDEVVSKGIPVVVSAGNNNEDACNRSPASAKSAITVGATDLTDYKADFSNWGKCVTIFAPGDDIDSAGIASDKSVAMKSGTSFATPHISGIIATFLSEGSTPSEARQKLIAIADANPIQGYLPAGSPNLIAQNGYVH